MLTVLYIVGRTTLFTPVDINLQQVVDFLNFYACTVDIKKIIQDGGHLITSSKIFHELSKI